MKNQKIALLAIPVFAAIMIGATVSPAYGGEGGCSDLIIDIKPQSDPNSINTFANGVIPVAILGGAGCDIFDIDPDTLAFGPAGASPIHRNGPHVDDANEDGFLDLVSHYRTEETGIAFGDTVACLTGVLFDGTTFEGCDAVNTVPQT